MIEVILAVCNGIILFAFIAVVLLSRATYRKQQSTIEVQEQTITALQNKIRQLDSQSIERGENWSQYL